MTTSLRFAVSIVDTEGKIYNRSQLLIPINLMLNVFVLFAMPPSRTQDIPVRDICPDSC